MFGLKTYIRENGVAAFILSVFALPFMVAPFSYFSILYYPIIILFFIHNLNHSKSFSISIVVAIIMAAIGIVLNDPLPVFKPWQRLALFIVVLGSFGPLFKGNSSAVFHAQLFRWIALFCCIVGTISFFCAFLGINYGGTAQIDGISNASSSVFGGLCGHSMLLGPIAAVGMLAAFHRFIDTWLKDNRCEYKYAFASFACFASMLLASSRGAIMACFCAVIYVLVNVNRKKNKLYTYLFVILLIVLCVGWPFFEILMQGVIRKQEASMAAGGQFSSRNSLWDDRWAEFISNPIFGVGFASQKIITFESSAITGIIEPGSSYLGILSMTGLASAIPIFYVFYKSLLMKYSKKLTLLPPLPKCVFIFFIVHMIVEGYAFAGGSILCVILWSCVAANMSIKECTVCKTI